MKIKIKYKKASYTVEASLLLPLVLSVITFLIYGCFYLYDRTVLTGLAYESALFGSRMEENNKDIILQQTKEKGNQLLSKKVINTRGIVTQVKVSGDNVLVSYRGDFKVPGGVLIEMLIKKYVVEIKVEGEAKRLHQVSFLRECRTVEALLDNSREKGEKAQ